MHSAIGALRLPWMVRIILLLCCLLWAQAQAASVQDVRLWRAPDHTRIVLDLSAPAQHRVLVLQNPARIVLDVSDTALRAEIAGLDLEDTPIRRIRSGIRDGSDLRMVFDLRAAVTPRSFALEANCQDR